MSHTMVNAKDKNTGPGSFTFVGVMLTDFQS